MEEFSVKNMIFSSSATVYGTPMYLPLDEKHDCKGDAITNPYGKSKYLCEHILKDVSIGHPVCINGNTMRIDSTSMILLRRIGIL
jgi:UDP-glucose 4-epimerase